MVGEEQELSEGGVKFFGQQFPPSAPAFLFHKKSSAQVGLQLKYNINFVKI